MQELGENCVTGASEGVRCMFGVCRPGAGPRRWLDENCSSGGEDGGDNVTAARLLAAEELVPGMRIVKALTKQDLHTGQARAPYLNSHPT